MIKLDRALVTINGDPQQRPVKFIMFTCACGLTVAEFVTEGPQFSLPNYFADGRALNVWHVEIDRLKGQLSMSPSIDLSAIKPHPPSCHMFVNGSFEWFADDSAVWGPR